MYTMSQLRRFAISMGICERLEELGFALGPDRFWAYRRRGDMIDVVQVWATSSKKTVRFPICIYAESIVEDYDFDMFPRGFANNRASLTNLYLSKKGVSVSYGFWGVENEVRAAETIRNFIECLRKFAIPWFDDVRSGPDLYGVISPSVKEGKNGEFYRRELVEKW